MLFVKFLTQRLQAKNGNSQLYPIKSRLVSVKLFTEASNSG